MPRGIQINSFSGLSSALQGLQRASEGVREAAQVIAEGEVDAAAFVELKISEHDYRANAKSLQVQMDMEKELLDILA